jgi:seryl-tRNA synthetase
MCYYDLIELRMMRREERRPTVLSKLDEIIDNVDKINPKIELIEKNLSQTLLEIGFGTSEFVIAAAGEETALEIETAVREEYSTPGWIIEGLLERAGFHIDKKEYSEGFMAVYECTKC